MPPTLSSGSLMRSNTPSRTWVEERPVRSRLGDKTTYDARAYQHA